MTTAEQVEVTTLDRYAMDAGLPSIDLLKIDAEGHDLAVLQGAETLIKEGRIRYIQFEFGGANIDSRTYLRDFVRLLSPRYNLFRVVIDGLEPLEYDEREEIFVTANFFAELADDVSTGGA